MMKRKYFILSLGLIVAANTTVLLKVNTPLSFMLWLGALVTLLASVWHSRESAGHLRLIKSEWILAGMTIFLLLVTRVLIWDYNRVIQDEFGLGYYSATHGFPLREFFVPVQDSRYLVQLPALFFIIQKGIFAIFGTGMFGLKASLLPFLAMLGIMLFMVARDIFDMRTAILTVILYAFWAPNIYFDAFLQTFTMCTAFYLLFFYMMLKFLKKSNGRHGVLLGFSCGLCYLSAYFSSYIALPVAVLAMLVWMFFKSAVPRVKATLLFVVAFLWVVLPFLSQCLVMKKFYFGERFEQTNLTNLSLSPEQAVRWDQYWTLLKQNAVQAIRCFYQNDIGGNQGWWYGKMALFDPFVLGLFVLGLVCLLYLMVFRKKWELLLVLLTIFLGWSSMVLTMPPPSYQRFNIAFPFVAMTMAAVFFCFYQIKWIRPAVKSLTVAIILFVYVGVNISAFNQVVLRDTYYAPGGIFQQVEMVKYAKRFPGKKVYIAAFPTFHLPLMLYFMSGHKNVPCDYSFVLTSRLDPAEDYLYLILYPNEKIEAEFRTADPQGKWIKTFYPGFFNRTQV